MGLFQRLRCILTEMEASLQCFGARGDGERERKREKERCVNVPISHLRTVISKGGREPERQYKFYLWLSCPVQLQQGV